MSTILAEDLPAARWAGRALPQRDDERRTHLEVVTSRSQRKARPRTVYALITIATLVAIVVAQLLLSIAVSQGAYQIAALQSTQTTLQRARQAISEDLDRVASPQNLAANANALGMVSNSNPVYLRLSNGAVLGTPAPAAATAGTVTGGLGNLVPNSLLAGVPLVAQPVAGQPTTGAAGTPVNPAAVSVAGAPSAPQNVPFDGALPTPVTH